MRLPDPIANTTTEAYLAYKAGVLNIGDLKPSLYDPYLHYDAWLAYWAGLVDTYPIHDVGKNLFDKDHAKIAHYYSVPAPEYFRENTAAVVIVVPVVEGKTYTVSSTNRALVDNLANVAYTDKIITATSGPWLSRTMWEAADTSITTTAPEGSRYAYIYAKWSNSASAIAEMLATIQVEEGSTATPYEPYTGTPEMLTDEEALVAYLSGVTNTYPEEYSDPIDARITGYLRYLVSARFGRPDYPVNNIEFYLSLMKPPIVTNDTPSSNIELDNTDWAELIDVKMYGDTSQQTYTGKNLLNYVPQTSTAQGLSSTYDAQTGIIHVTGTATSSWSDISRTVSSPIEAGTYTLSSEVVAGSFARNVDLRTKKNGADVQTLYAQAGTSKTATLQEADAYRIYIATVANTVYDFQMRVQLEAGSTATTFEPYVGGVPSPNPDYPQAVQTVTGRQKIEVQKIEDVSLAQDSTGGGSYDSDTHTYTSTTRAGVNAWCKKYEVENVESVNFFTTNITSAEYRCVFSNSDVSTSADMVSLTNGSGSGSIAKGKHMVLNSANRKYLYVSFRTLTNGISATLVEPRIGFSNSKQEYEVNLGKNLFGGSIYKENYIIASNGAEIPSTSGVITTAVKVEPNKTYTASVKWGESSPDKYMRAGIYTGDMTFISRPSSPALGAPVTFTTPANAQYVRLSYYVPAAEVQLELGSTATSYAPYFEPIELCKIGNYQDYIYKDGQQWYVHKEVGKEVLNSSSHGGWQLTTSADGYLRADTVSGIGFPSNMGYCDNLVVRTGSHGSYEYIWFQPSAAGKIYLQILASRVSSLTLAAFEDWIDSATPTVYYALTTPTDTPITNVALVAQLDALAAAKSYNDKTYIAVEATDPNLPALLKVEAGEYR